MTAWRRAASIALVLAAGSCSLWWPAAARAADALPPGAFVTETRTVPEFRAVALEGSVDLLVRQGPQQVQVTAGDPQLPRLETFVQDGKDGPTLVVRWKRESRGLRWLWDWSWFGKGGHRSPAVLVTVTVPNLSAVRAAGSGDIEFERFETPALTLSMSGSGDARLRSLTTTDLEVSISGSGDLAGTGSASKLTLSIAGSGDARLANLRADDVEVRIAGSGDAAVNAQKSLTVSIAGSGDVSYSGNPMLKSSVAGSGSISRR